MMAFTPAGKQLPDISQYNRRIQRRYWKRRWFDDKYWKVCKELTAKSCRRFVHSKGRNKHLLFAAYTKYIKDLKKNQHWNQVYI